MVGDVVGGLEAKPCAVVTAAGDLVTRVLPNSPGEGFAVGLRIVAILGGERQKMVVELDDEIIGQLVAVSRALTASRIMKTVSSK